MHMDFIIPREEYLNVNYIKMNLLDAPFGCP